MKVYNLVPWTNANLDKGVVFVETSSSLGPFHIDNCHSLTSQVQSSDRLINIIDSISRQKLCTY